MKIALAAARFPVVSETFIRNIATRLIDRGHDVRILALRGPAAEKSRARDADIERYRLVERTTFGRPSPPTLAARWLRAGRLRGTPGVLLRGLNPLLVGRDGPTLKALLGAAPFVGGAFDVVHAQYGDIGRRVEQMRAIGALRGALVTSLRGNDLFGAVERNGARLYRRLAAHGEYFLPNSDYFRARALEVGFPPERTETWYSGLDTGRFFEREGEPPANPPRLIAVGRLVEKKGFGDAIRALRSLRGVRLDVVGDGRLRGALEELADERVRFLGNRTPAEIRALLAESHVFVAPSVTGPHGLADGPVNTAKEAMATGLPVVATRHGGIPELVEDGVSGLLVPERDPAALAEAVRALLGDPERRRAMGRAGARIVRERFSLDRQIDRLEEIYRAVTSSSACTGRPS